MADQYLTTFPNLRCFQQAEEALAKFNLPHEILSPEVGYLRVGVSRYCGTAGSEN